MMTGRACNFLFPLSRWHDYSSRIQVLTVRADKIDTFSFSFERVKWKKHCLPLTKSVFQRHSDTQLCGIRWVQTHFCYRVCPLLLRCQLATLYASQSSSEPLVPVRKIFVSWGSHPRPRSHWFRDGIDLISLPFTSAAFASIKAIQTQVPANVTSQVNDSRIDSHGKLSYVFGNITHTNYSLESTLYLTGIDPWSQ